MEKNSNRKIHGRANLSHTHTHLIFRKKLHDDDDYFHFLFLFFINFHSRKIFFLIIMKKMKYQVTENMKLKNYY